MTILAPVTKSESSTDPRDPLARLENLFDPGTTMPLHARDKSGVLAASGNIDGVRTIAYCSDATVMGGAMGVGRLQTPRQSHRYRHRGRVPHRGPLALRWRASG